MFGRAVAFVELVDTASAVDDFLFSCEERVADRADFDFYDVLVLGCFVHKLCSAGTGEFGLANFWVDVFFHNLYYSPGWGLLSMDLLCGIILVGGGMGKKTLTVEQIKSRVASVARKHPVEKISMFGSYARGMQTTGSDLDLLVTFKETEPLTLFTIVKFEQDLKKAMGISVDVIPAPIEEDSLIVIDAEVPIYG